MRGLIAKLLRRRCPARPRAAGGAMLRQALAAIAAHHRAEGLQAPFPKAALARLLPADAVIVDAGAHVGADTREFSALLPRGRVLAFEPAPDLYALLRTNTAGIANVQVEPLGLSDQPGRVKLHISSGSSDAASSLLPPKEILAFHPGNRFERAVEVEVVRLDEWLTAQGIAMVDMLWLDLQGYELAVLRSMATWLPAVSFLFIEVSLTEVYEGVPLYPEVRAFLAAQNFDVVFEQLPWPDAGNVLAVNRGLLG